MDCGNEFLSRVIAHHKWILSTDDFFHRTNSDVLTGIVREKERQDKRPAFLFSEVTGFALLDFLTISALTGSSTFEQRAKEAGEWLCCPQPPDESIKSLWEADGIPSAWQNGWAGCRYYLEVDDNPELLDSFAHGNIFIFDCAIILLGLVQLWQRTYDPRLYERISSLGDKLHSLVRDNGSVPAVIDRSEQPIPEEKAKWSRQTGAFHAKVAEALAELSVVEVEARMESPSVSKLRRSACNICDYVLTKQMDNGRFITSEAHGDWTTELHPHMYAAEGLFRVGEILAEPRYVQAAIDAVWWALDHFSTENDLIPQQFAPTLIRSRYRVDAVAQVVRLASQLEQRGLLSQDSSNKLDGLAKGLFRLQDQTTGKFPYGFYEDGTEAKTDSYWTQWFCFGAQLEYLAARASRCTALVVLAGGKGTRCWPVSTETRPKPFSYAFLGHKSLVQATCDRFRGLVQPERTFVICTPEAEQWARKQLPDLPRNSFVLEPGETPSLRESLGTVLGRLNANDAADVKAIIVTVADGLFRPPHGFLGATLRAALDCIEKCDSVVCIGRATKQHDRSLGHLLFTNDATAGDIKPVETFKEKPQSDPQEAGDYDGLGMAHYVGCEVWPIQQLRQKVDTKGWEWGRHLEDSKLRKAVSLLPPNTLFLDAGVPGENAIDYFRGTPFDRGNGVVVLGAHEARVVTQSCRNILVVVDKGLIGAPRTTQVIDVRDHIILLSDYAWGVLVLPLDQSEAIPDLRSMAKGEILKEFCSGGSTNPRHHEVFSLGGDSRCSSKWGLVCSFHTTALDLSATQETIRALGRRSTKLGECDAELLLDVIDDKIVRHLLAVCHVGEWIHAKLHLREDEQLLHRALLYHDLGGVLSGPKYDREREILGLLKDESRLTLAMDRSVLGEVLRHKGKLTKNLEKELSWLNDSVTSACKVLASKEIRDWEWRDELLYLLANQDVAYRFGEAVIQSGVCRGIQDLASRISHVQQVWAVMQTADQWVCLNTVWRESLADRSRDDVAGGLAFLTHQFNTAGVDPLPFIRGILDLAVDEPMRKWTESELLETKKGGRGFWPSDELLFKTRERETNSQEVHEAYCECEKFGKYTEEAKQHMTSLPQRLKVLEACIKVEEGEPGPHSYLATNWRLLSREVLKYEIDHRPNE